MNKSEEKKLRLLIREVLQLKNKKQMFEENQLRSVIRNLIVEGDVDSDTKPAPYESTPINMLADAFNEILPIIKSGLRKLSKPEERESYREHVVEKFKSIFDGFEALDSGAVGPAGALGESGLMEQETDVEGVNVKVDDPDRIMPSDGKEDDRFKEDKIDPEQEFENEFQSFAKPGRNPTGARVAFETINKSNIETTLADKRKTLFDDADKQEFREFGLYNIDLWLLTYEKELADTKAQEPAFSEPMVDKPSGAKVSASAQEFETPGGRSPEEDFEDLGMEPEEEQEEGIPQLGEI
tara:strand:+ start:15599 stop:16486 length:888 start_codon:yes stop_codon:yes gene_type:complete